MMTSPLEVCVDERRSPDVFRLTDATSNSESPADWPYAPYDVKTIRVTLAIACLTLFRTFIRFSSAKVHPIFGSSFAPGELRVPYIYYAIASQTLGSSKIFDGH